MEWIMRLLGFKSPLAKKQQKLAELQKKGFEAQRRGDLRAAGNYYHEAEVLETEIVEMLEKKNS